MLHKFNIFQIEKKNHTIFFVQQCITFLKIISLKYKEDQIKVAKKKSHSSDIIELKCPDIKYILTEASTSE